jgi:hypothetical protein
MALKADAKLDARAIPAKDKNFIKIIFSTIFKTKV